MNQVVSFIAGYALVGLCTLCALVYGRVRAMERGTQHDVEGATAWEYTKVYLLLALIWPVSWAVALVIASQGRWR